MLSVVAPSNRKVALLDISLLSLETCSFRSRLAIPDRQRFRLRAFGPMVEAVATIVKNQTVMRIMLVLRVRKV